MNHIVTIRVKSVQKTKGEEEQVIDLVTEAQMTTREGSVFLTYEESELSGIDGAKTQLQVGDDFVHMRRAYHGVTEMFFEINKRSTSEYHTPYGKFKLETMTRSLAICLGPLLRIDIEYDVSLQSMFESTNRLQIEVLGHGS